MLSSDGQAGGILMGSYLMESQDGNGRRGTVRVTFHLFPSGIDKPGVGPKLLSLGVPPGNRVVVIEDDYSEWEEYRAIRSVTYGLPSQPGDQIPAGVEARRYMLGDADFNVLVYLQQVVVEGMVALGEIAWPEGRFPVYSLLHIDPATDQPELRRALLMVSAIKLHAGGRRRGSFKGEVWSRRRILEWWQEANESYARDREPTLAEFADAMGVKDRRTARKRVKDVGLHWPPTQEQQDELLDSQ
jgi:hypothetical protein